MSVYVVCWIFLQTFQTGFCIQANSVDPDQTAPRGAVWSGSTLFAKMTFKITSRWQSTTVVVIGSLGVKYLSQFYSLQVSPSIDLEVPGWQPGLSLNPFRPSIL